MADSPRPFDRMTALAVFDSIVVDAEYPTGGADVHIGPDVWRRLKKIARQRDEQKR